MAPPLMYVVCILAKECDVVVVIGEFNGILRRERDQSRDDISRLLVLRAEAHVNVAPKNITLATLTEQD